MAGIEKSCLEVADLGKTPVAIRVEELLALEYPYLDLRSKMRAWQQAFSKLMLDNVFKGYNIPTVLGELQDQQSCSAIKLEIMRKLIEGAK